MNLRQALNKGAAAAGRRDAALLLARAAGLTRTELFLHGETELPEYAAALYDESLAKRAEGMPVQYILGEWSFYGLDFITDGRALIPRRETEILAEAVIRLAKERFKPGEPVNILDMCAGGGCIAVALACHLPRASLTAADISPRALELARENAARNGVAERMRFVVSDVFSAFGGGETFDIIVSNPPYIPTGELAALPRDVTGYEPVNALDGGADGLDVYRRLIPESLARLGPGGALFLETGPSGGVSALMRGAGYLNITVLNDYAGLPRVVYGFGKDES